MTSLNENILQFLMDNGFKLKEYEDQGLTFYSKEIKDSQTLKKLIEHHYEIEEDEEINTKGISFIVEIQTNGESPQWVFTGGHEMFDILEDQQHFFEYVKEIERLIS
ncbi:hypothetical protein A9D36_09380 [Bacillus subtilis]|nr:hypothetical protein A9D36_09380 [Bacillus subtilis]